MNKRILAIEDTPSHLKLMQYMLQWKGYEAITALNGLEGLRKALDEHPDLIILDVMLPDLDGYEVCRRLRQKPETANLPVLMLSAKSRQSDKYIGLSAGADDYMTKPFTPSEILAKVETLLAGTDKSVDARS